MTTDPSAIAAALHDAPAWALIGMIMPDEQMRDLGVAELASWIAARLDPRPAPDMRQLVLAL